MGSTASRRQEPGASRPLSQPLSTDEASVRASLLGGYQRIPEQLAAQEEGNARRRMQYTSKLAACCCNTRDVLGQLFSCQTVLTLLILMVVATVLWFHWDQIGRRPTNATKAIHRIATTTTTTAPYE